jgi:hypothetical protein
MAIRHIIVNTPHNAFFHQLNLPAIMQMQNMAGITMLYEKETGSENMENFRQCPAIKSRSAMAGSECK